MSRARRAFRASSALIVLSLSLVEGVWAAACPPGSMVSAPAAAVTAARDSSHHHGGVQHTGDSPSPVHHDSPACPFGPVGALRGCTAAASLPSLPAPDLELSAERAEALPGIDVAHSLLLGTDLFRPPRP